MEEGGWDFDAFPLINDNGESGYRRVLKDNVVGNEVKEVVRIDKRLFKSRLEMQVADGEVILSLFQQKYGRNC